MGFLETIKHSRKVMVNKAKLELPEIIDSIPENNQIEMDIQDTIQQQNLIKPTQNEENK